MAFCHNCGSAHTDEELFCSNCGTQLEQSKSNFSESLVDSASTLGNSVASGSIQGNYSQWLGISVRVVAQFTQIVIQGLFDVDFGIDFFKGGDDTPRRRGILMTNIVKLSERFAVAPQQIYELLESYTNSLLKCGVEYTILDLSDKGCGDSWMEHTRLLTRFFVEGGYKGSSEPTFLFIVGGDDIVPMPVIDNLYYHASVAAGNKKYRDTTIDTDLPYAYLLGEQTQKMIYRGELFNQMPYLCVGRLPFDERCGIEVVIEYLKRSFNCHMSGGVQIKSSYGQTFRDWNNESTITSSVMNDSGLLPNYSAKYSSEFAHNNLLTSPGVVVGNVRQAFNTSADLLFFNMHGSDNPMNPNFMGSSVSFSPEELTLLERDNIVVSEACYGAKFKGLESDKSMLLSALKSRTLVYFGSSRIALGGGGYKYERVEDLMSADLYFKYLLDGITLGGFPVGYSVEYARRQYIKARPKLGLRDFLTIAEFNLFGDPSIMSQIANEESEGSEESKAEPMEMVPLAQDRDEAGFEVETLYDSESQGGSLLGMIRGYVDSSIKEIVDTMNKELYELHGLKPRELTIVNRTKYRDGSSSMEFVYRKKDGDIDKIYVASVEGEGAKTQVLISK